jgi:hypothetical protein
MPHTDKTEVTVMALPDCDFCKYVDNIGRKARFDGVTKRGVWANMCQSHFEVEGIGLGLGVGQMLVVATHVEVNP